MELPSLRTTQAFQIRHWHGLRDTDGSDRRASPDGGSGAGRSGADASLVGQGRPRESVSSRRKEWWGPRHHQFRKAFVVNGLWLSWKQFQRLHARSGEDPSSRTPTDRKCPKRPVVSIEIRQRGEPVRRSGRPTWWQPVCGIVHPEWRMSDAGAEKVPRKAAGPEARLSPPCSDAPRTRFGTPTRAGRRGSLRVEGCVRAPPSRIRGRPETQPPGLLEAEVPALPLPHPHKHQPVTLPAPVHFVAGPAPLPRIRGARGTQPRSLIMTTPGRSFAHPAAP